MSPIDMALSVMLLSLEFQMGGTNMAIKYKEGDFRQGYLYQVTEDIEIAYKLEGKFTNEI